MNEYEQALTRIIELEDKMDNQDLTMERRLKAKDRLIAELLEALKTIFMDTKSHYIREIAGKAIRKAKEK